MKADPKVMLPTLGSMKDLRRLAADLRSEGIRLVLGLVFNHTSDEHEWAIRAKQGDLRISDECEKNLREIFPDESPGNFSYCDELAMLNGYAYLADRDSRHPTAKQTEASK